MSAISRLPEELLLSILSFLDRPAPSVSSTEEVPSEATLLKSHPSETPLKQCSLISRLWRRLCAPLLFRHLKVPLQTILPPAHYCPYVDRCTHVPRSPLISTTWSNPFRSTQEAELDALVAFARAYGLPRLRPSLTIHQLVPCNNIAPLGYSTLQQLWEALLSALSPRTLTIIAPPKNLGELCSRTVELSDAWAFKIALQRIDLSIPSSDSQGEQSQHLLLNDTQTIKSSNRSCSVPAHNAETSIKDPSPLTLLPWTHVTYHVGSCLRVYGEYHYFEKRPPCLLSCTPLRPHGGFAHTLSHKSVQLDRRPLTPSLGHDLRSLTYIAVFPHVVHLDALVKAITGTTALWTVPATPNPIPTLLNLRTLTIRLTPTPNSRELSDLDLVGRGNLNLRDCWTEVERAYDLLVRTIHVAGSWCYMEGTNGREPALNIAGRKPPRILPRFREFISRDVEDGFFGKEVEQMFTELAPGWVKMGARTGVWVRKKVDGKNSAGLIHDGNGSGDEDKDELMHCEYVWQPTESGERRLMMRDMLQ